MRSIEVAERRARLARRHRLASAERAGDVTEAARAVVCLHATDPATVFLSAWARTNGMRVADLERALYVERSLVKHLAMRRTLFVFPRELVGAAQAGAGDRVAGSERRRLIREVERAGLHADGAAWLERAEREVLAALAGGHEATSTELRARIPALAGAITYGAGRSWGGEVPVGPRVLTTLSAAGRIVRASNDGRWTTSRPRWAAMADWLGEEPEQMPVAEGVARLVRAWLSRFGPGTAADIRWWLGSTVALVNRALSEIDAVEVDLGAGTGYVLADDVEPVEAPEPWAALLPALDPSTMGWFERDWYLGPHRAAIFDANGNAGPTVWCDGRVVGGWRQDEEGAIEVQLLEDVDAGGAALIEHEARRLTDWLGGARVLPRFPSPLFRALAG